MDKVTRVIGREEEYLGALFCPLGKGHRAGGEPARIGWGQAGLQELRECLEKREWIAGKRLMRRTEMFVVIRNMK